MKNLKDSPDGEGFSPIVETISPIAACQKSNNLRIVLYRSAARDKILQLHDQGLSIRAIADEVGRSRTTVHRHITRRRGPNAGVVLPQ